MQLWPIRANCGDYYCGCGGGHIVGIATSESEAERLATEAREATRVLKRKTRKVSSLPFHLREIIETVEDIPVWDGVYIDDPIETDTFINK